MVSLIDYRKYWEGVADRITDIHAVVPVTVDQDISHFVSSLYAQQFPALFIVLPESVGQGRNVDSYTERNEAMVFIADKYDPQRSMGAVQCLERLQPVAEDIKQVLLADMAAGCPLLRDLDLASMRTVPVTSLYNILAGWMISFAFKD